MQEIWKWIPGYENIYEISNTGKVKRKRRFLKVIESGEYVYAYLTKNSIGKQVNIRNILDEVFGSEHIYATTEGVDLNEQ